MDATPLTMAQQIAAAVSDFQEHSTGHMPSAVTVVLSEGTLVITLHDALSPAEKVLATKPAGAEQVQEFHRRLFSNASAPLQEEIERITGCEIREAVLVVEPGSGAIVHAFTSGAMVLVFLLDGIASTSESNSKTYPVLRDRVV